MSRRAGLVHVNAAKFALAVMAGAMASVCAQAGAWAQDVVTLRGEAHGSFARIISEWPEALDGAQITTNADVVNGVLVIRFPRPVTADPSVILEAFPSLMALARFDAEGQILRIALTKPARVHISQSFNLTAIDILDENDTNDPEDIISPRAAREAREAEEAAALAAELARIVAQAPPRLPLQIGRASCRERV